MCANICHSTGQLLAFVKEFLANSAADHAITVRIEPVDLGEGARRAVQNYQEAAVRKNLGLQLAVPDEPVFVCADHGAVRQVLENLISNAVKFSPLGSPILISVSQTENGVDCVVQDRGPGFSPEDKTLMFRRYKRLSARPTAGEPSTGLGLSIVKKLVHAMNADLTCSSELGQGATFTLHFPN
jgi:two-component system sensor histidine kinase/response regulator